MLNAQCVMNSAFNCALSLTNYALNLNGASQFEVPEKIFRRHSARFAVVRIRADFAGSLSRIVYLHDVKLHELGFGRGANFFGNVGGLALELEDGGRSNANFVCLRDNRRFACAVAARYRDCRVADFLVAVHVAFPVLSCVSIDVRA